MDSSDQQAEISMRFDVCYQVILLLGMALVLAGHLHAKASSNPTEGLKTHVLAFEEECPAPERCLQHLGKSTFLMLNVLSECMLLEDILKDSDESVSDERARFLRYLVANSNVAVDQSDTNRILGLQRVFNHAYRWRAMQLIDNQALFLWCLEELVALDLLTNEELRDYYENCRHYHPRTSQNKGFLLLQTKLAASGIEIEIDGVYGEQTMRALHSFQRSGELAVTQFPDSSTLVSLGIDPDLFWSMSVSKDLFKISTEVTD